MTSNFEDMDVADILMGVESVLYNGGTQAVRDFIAYPKIDFLLKKVTQFYQNSLRNILLNDAKPSAEDNIHILYPSLSMFSNMLIAILEDSSEITAQKFLNLEFVSLL